MKPLTTNDPDIVLGLQDEIRRSEESRYTKPFALRSFGRTRNQLSRRRDLFGAAPRSVQYWLKRFEEDGMAGLSEEERSGTPVPLTENN